MTKFYKNWRTWALMCLFLAVEMPVWAQFNEDFETEITNSTTFSGGESPFKLLTPLK